MSWILSIRGSWFLTFDKGFIQPPEEPASPILCRAQAVQAGIWPEHGGTALDLMTAKGEGGLGE